MEVDENLVTVKNAYSSLLEMVSSPDEGNALVALAMLRTIANENDYLYIILLFKSSLPNQNMEYRRKFWKENAQNCYEIIRALNLHWGNDIHYNEIYEIVKKRNGDMEFLLEEFSKYIKKQLVNLGEVLLNECELKITLK
jgi:hypothetical protein